MKDTEPMATAKKTAAAPAAKKTAAAAAPKAATVAAKKAAPVKAAPVKAAPVKAAPVKAAAPAKKVAKTAAAPAPAKKAAAPAKAPVAKVAAVAKPIKTAFNKTALNAHLAELSGVDPKATKAVVAALEATILLSIHKKGLGEFTLPGLLKITAQNVPAKKKRVGKDPFTGQERTFAAKPATTKIKTRALKKLKDAAI